MAYKPGRHDFSWFLTQGLTNWTRPKVKRPRAAVGMGVGRYLPKHAAPTGYSRSFGPRR